ncbi:MAG: hypothetical protein IOC92_05015 [Rhodobacter sp.]|nr:hypothetical protein [Rhodobacter sp.]MCA3456010.1 hypothetical protein [Rhodobacter sp.]MCA3460533.1 hypothetical protein [Rhodobacter sp.]MCA3463887.1 hypothetical protein [Rhodobacter sp.]MCA3468299.1 hypothetical protein [Rhodobacter sp.]
MGDELDQWGYGALGILQTLLSFGAILLPFLILFVIWAGIRYNRRAAKSYQENALQSLTLLRENHESTQALVTATQAQAAALERIAQALERQHPAP